MDVLITECTEKKEVNISEKKNAVVAELLQQHWDMVVAQQIKRTKSVELMSLWRLIGALLVLSATTGDSANKIVLPQQISNSDNTINVPTGMHHFTKNSILAGSKGTVVSSNGVIVAGNTAHASSVPSSPFNIGKRDCLLIFSNETKEVTKPRPRHHPHQRRHHHHHHEHHHQHQH
uniref:Uncharacterized protein n=1 Tax=Glossina pallidipes TaxID=7398 RepID=A0A1B0A500_GLOPL